MNEATLKTKIKKLLTPGRAVSNGDLHLIIEHCPKHRAQAWDHLLGQPQTYQDLRWILYSGAPGSTQYKVSAEKELLEMDAALGRRTK
jgi:hypothetical protein